MKFGDVVLCPEGHYGVVIELFFPKGEAYVVWQGCGGQYYPLGELTPDADGTGAAALAPFGTRYTGPEGEPVVRLERDGERYLYAREIVRNPSGLVSCWMLIAGELPQGWPTA